MAAWGYGLATVPYVVGLIVIAMNSFVPTQIGPIIAIMLLSALYMLLPVTYMVVKRLNQEINQD